MPMTDSPAQTLSFNETSNTFDSFLSYHPEMMCTLGNLLITFKDGQVWTHDSDLYNNFYGVQYPSTITMVFNKDAAIKKKYKSLGYQSSDIWDCPEIETSMVNTDTGLPQQSNLIVEDIVIEEDVKTAAFLRDKNSMDDEIEGLNEGDFLGGVWIKTKFQFDGDNLTNFELPYVTYTPSNRNF